MLAQPEFESGSPLFAHRKAPGSLPKGVGRRISPQHPGLPFSRVVHPHGPESMRLSLKRLAYLLIPRGPRLTGDVSFGSRRTKVNSSPTSLSPSIL
jgi:hypothetical protein